jgi:hypothetical protein
LVYLDLGNSHLRQLEPAPTPAVIDEFTRQGWRSVSLLAVPYGAVLMASANAPEFLRDRSGLILSDWPGADGWFEPQSDTASRRDEPISAPSLRVPHRPRWPTHPG